jgi:hypothetical protein
MKGRKSLALICLLAALGCGAGFMLSRGYFHLSSINSNTSRCLSSGEKATYTILQKGQPALVRVSVLDSASTTVWSRDTEIPFSDISEPVYFGSCYFYLDQIFNYDKKLDKPLPNYSFEIWRFSYFTLQGNKIVTAEASKTGALNDLARAYSSSYTIDPSEKYITLERGYLENNDYALVFKDINTGHDVYTLPLADVLKSHPNASGSFSTPEWVTRPDGVWMDGDIYDGSRWTAFYYIKRDTWETKIYDTPADYQPGVERAAPPFAPYLAYTNVIDWAGGSQEIRDQLLDQQIADGMKKSLIVANLVTGATTTIVTVPIDKNHSFGPTWLDDSTLQYTMPNGSVHTYTLK